MAYKDLPPLRHKELSCLLKFYKLKHSMQKLDLFSRVTLAKTTKSMYVCFASQFRNFCIKISDMTSFLMTHEYISVEQHVPSSSPETLALFIGFKKGAKHNQLKNDAGEPILGSDLNPILMDGGWNNPRIVNHFLACMTMLH